MDINIGDAGANIFCDRNMLTSRSYIKLTIDYQMNILFGVLYCGKPLRYIHKSKWQAVLYRSNLRVPVVCNTLRWRHINGNLANTNNQSIVSSMMVYMRIIEISVFALPEADSPHSVSVMPPEPLCVFWSSCNRSPRIMVYHINGWPAVP